MLQCNTPNTQSCHFGLQVSVVVEMQFSENSAQIMQ